MLFVVGRLDQLHILGHADRRRLELLQIGNGTLCNAALGAFLGGQVEQHDRHLDVDQMGGDLRAHHARASTATFFIESGHDCIHFSYS
jgi:hypothetical protein